jgi:hypothetical protein
MKPNGDDEFEDVPLIFDLDVMNPETCSHTHLYPWVYYALNEDRLHPIIVFFTSFCPYVQKLDLMSPSSTFIGFYGSLGNGRFINRPV